MARPSMPSKRTDLSLAWITNADLSSAVTTEEGIYIFDPDRGRSGRTVTFLPNAELGAPSGREDMEPGQAIRPDEYATTAQVEGLGYAGVYVPSGGAHPVWARHAREIPENRLEHLLPFRT